MIERRAKRRKKSSQRVPGLEEEGLMMSGESEVDGGSGLRLRYVERDGDILERGAASFVYIARGDLSSDWMTVEGRPKL